MIEIEMSLFKLIIVLSLSKKFALALEANDTNLACTSHPRNYGPVKKIRSEFVKKFLEPANLNQSIYLDSKKVWPINPTLAWSACSAICINRNIAQRQLASSKDKNDQNKTPVGKAAGNCEIFFMGNAANNTCITGAFDASKIVYKDQASGLTEVRALSKSETYKTEWRVFPVQANSSMPCDKSIWKTYDGKIETTVIMGSTLTRHIYFQFDFGECRLNFTRIIVESQKNPTNGFEYFEVRISDNALQSDLVINTTRPQCGNQIVSAKFDGTRYKATFECNLNGRFVTVQRFYVYNCAVPNDTLTYYVPSSMTISEISFYATV